MLSGIFMKRRKYKEKRKPPEVIYCTMCHMVNVSNDDPEQECICLLCWEKLHLTKVHNKGSQL